MRGHQGGQRAGREARCYSSGCGIIALFKPPFKPTNRRDPRMKPKLNPEVLKLRFVSFLTALAGYGFSTLAKTILLVSTSIAGLSAFRVIERLQPLHHFSACSQPLRSVHRTWPSGRTRHDSYPLRTAARRQRRLAMTSV